MGGSLADIFNCRLETPEDIWDFKLFLLTFIITIIWCFFMFVEAFQLNVPGHTISLEITMGWIGTIAGYTGRKIVARRNSPDLSGKGFGRTLAIATVLYGFGLYIAYLFRSDMVIPPQLTFGINAVIAHLFGWEWLKANHSVKNGNENGHAGKTPNLI